MSIIHSIKSYKTYLKYLCIITIIIHVFIFLNFKDVMKVNQIRKQTRANAFIISTNCSSARFNFTKQNLQRVFPNFFTIYCFKPILLNDSRIEQSASLLTKKLASNLITFVTLWTYEIQKFSTNDELEWSFVFEDDVNFIEPSNFSLPNYINAIQELMHHPEIQLKHGAFYLGICGPTFSNDTQTLITLFSNNTLLSKKGCGRCLHGMGLTTKRARTFWTEISLYHPIPDGPTDIYFDKYCLKNGNLYYILGANMHWPPNTGHYGIAYQDRQRFRSQVF